jgi:ligand-binding sensor domain-containing protein
LTSATVQAIARDSRGYLWAGTPSGLCRFNGTRFEKITLTDEVSHRPTEQDILKLKIDSNQNLWVLLPNETGFVNTTTLQYTRVKTGHFTALGLNRNLQAVVFGADSLFVFDFQGKQVAVHAYHMGDDAGKIDSAFFFDGIFPSGNNKLWVSSGNLLWLTGKDWKFKFSLAIPQGTQPEPVTIRDVLEWSADKVFIASYGCGVMVYNPTKGTLQALPGFSGRTTCKSLAKWKDADGKIWLLAAADRQWLMVDPVTLAFKTFVHVPGDANAFPFANQSLVVYTDQQGIAWTGTEDGLVAIQPFRQLMHRLQFSSAHRWNEKPVFDGLPFSLLQTETGFAVGGWYSKGWHWFDENWGHVKSVQQVHGQGQLLWQGVYGQYYDGKGTYWLSTDSGLICWKQGKSQVFFPPGLDKTNAFIFRKITPLPDQNLLITTRRGLYYFNTVTRQFYKGYRSVKGNANGLPDADVNDCFLAKDGTLFVTTGMGAFRKGVGEEKFALLASLVTGAPTNSFLGITEDNGGNTWFGSFNGLMRLKTGSDSISFETNTPAAKIFRLLADEAGRIWAISSNGLLCRNTNGKWLQFTMANSGWPLDYADGYFEKDKEGRIYAGMNKWHVDFAPEQLLENLPHAVVDVEGAITNDSLIRIGKNRIELPAGTGIFGVLVNDLNFNGTSGNSLLYRLGNGKQQHWQPVDNNRILFANLKPGEYILEIKGMQQWNNQDDVYTCTISLFPFWYQTQLFLFSCMGILLLFLFWLVKCLLARQRLSTQNDRQLKEAQMQALRTQMNPHFIFNSLNSINSFILDRKTDEASEYLTTFGKLLRTTLDLTRANSVKLDRELAALQLYINMEVTRVSNFDYSIRVQKDIHPEQVDVPPLILQPFVENAIWHGLSNKKGMGMLTINIGLKERDWLHITIADDGIGRVQAAGIKKALKAHKSYGIEITKNRLKLQHPQNDVIIEDLMENGKAAGTRVTILIHIA